MLVASSDKLQVYEMLHYSPQQSDRLAQESEGSALAQDFLTFGQFCFFATELKRKYVEADDDDTSRYPQQHTFLNFFLIMMSKGLVSTGQYSKLDQLRVFSTHFEKIRVTSTHF